MPKTVLEIDVEDTKFKAFAEALDKVQKSLAEANKKLGEMGKVGGDAADKTAKGFSKTQKALQDMNKAARDGIELFKRMASVAADIAKSFANAAFSVAKWLAFGAIGTGFGLGALGSVAAGTRREALGLGVSTGALRSARVNLGRYADVDSVLSAIAESQFDPTKGLGYQTFGIQNQQRKTPDQILSEVLLKGGEVFKRFSGNRTLLEASGALQFTDYETLRRLSGEKRSDISASINRSRLDAPTYDLNAKAWQEFTTNMQRATTQIESTLINGLVKVTPILTRFGEAIAMVITKFLNSPLFQGFLDKAIKGLDKFSNYLLSPEFSKDIDNMLLSIQSFAEQVYGIAEDIGQARDAIEHPGKSIKNWFSNTFTVKDPFFDIFLSKTAKQYGLDRNTLRALVAAEHSDPNAVSPRGAMGMFQLMPDTAKFYGVNAFDPNRSAEAAAQFMSRLLNRYNNDYSKAFAAYNFGEGNVDKLVRQYGEGTGDNWKKHLPTETQRYLATPQVKVVIENTAGADIAAKAAQIPGVVH